MGVNLAPSLVQFLLVPRQCPVLFGIEHSRWQLRLPEQEQTFQERVLDIYPLFFSKITGHRFSYVKVTGAARLYPAASGGRQGYVYEPESARFAFHQSVITVAKTEPATPSRKPKK